MLELADVPGYLVQRGLIGPRDVADGVALSDVSRRNRVFLATTKHGRCFALKQARRADDAGVAYEAAALARLHRDAGDALRACLPRVAAYDRAGGVLALETARDARDVTRRHARGRYSLALARETGRALARVHDLPAGALRGLDGMTDPRAMLRAHRPRLEGLAALSAGAIDLLRVVQRDGAQCGELDALHDSWSEHATIHGDVRWDNCVAVGSSSRPRMVLIDWELAAPGDRAADVGSFLGEYLRAWLRSIPLVDPRDPARLLSLARLPLARMRPSIGAFWSGYAGAAPGADASRVLRRAIAFAAVRLLQSAFEEAQMLSTLHARVLQQQQLSATILARPDETAIVLLGLPASWVAP